MKFLMEHEMAVDAQELGFPSIQGCHAIVYQTSAGLFGYHNAGGSAADRFQPRAAQFASFVNGHGAQANQATRLYGVSFIGNNQRGYSGQAKSSWKLELIAFATALNYPGKISGYDLYKTLKVPSCSAYVEYRKNGPKCDVYIRQWTEKTAPARIDNPDPAAHRALSAKGFNLSMVNVPRVVTGVARDNLVQISKEQLR